MSCTRTQSPPDFRLILSWTGAIGLLWLLLLWKSVGFAQESLYSYPSSQSVATADFHAYAAGEHQFSPRRTLNVLSSVPPSDQLTPLISALYFAVLVIFIPLKTRLALWLNTSPIAYQLQLTTLNISRAPPVFR
ncbi:MAG: hypothetical protein B0W54_12015 [Cellvibrio sp. 79]|nr:MAG: hypothetical protein B0W54_12015 [Cellvibrio sp. 79]